jgi:hypothetical protein
MVFRKDVPLLALDEVGRYSLRGRRVYDEVLGRYAETATGLIYDRTWPLSDEVKERVARRRGITVEALQAEWDEAKRLAMSVGDWVQAGVYRSLEAYLSGSSDFTGEGVFDDLASELAGFCMERYAEFHGGELLSLSECWIECGIAAGSRTLSLYGRPDLVFFVGDDVFVFDLKTTKRDMGAVWPDTKRMKDPFDMYMDVKANHAKLQLGIYGSILRRCGWRRIFPFLIEVDSNTVGGDGLSTPHSCDVLRYRFVPLTYDTEERKFFSGIWECEALTRKPAEAAVVAAPAPVPAAVPPLLPFSDRESADAAGRAAAKELLDSGNVKVGELFLKVDLMKVFFDALSSGLKEAFLDELSKYPEGDEARFMGVPCRVAERAVYDYSGNERWAELNARIKELEAELKRDGEKAGVKVKWSVYPVLEWGKRKV